MFYVIYQADTAHTTCVNTKIACRIRSLHSLLGSTFGWREDGWEGGEQAATVGTEIKQGDGIIIWKLQEALL